MGCLQVRASYATAPPEFIDEVRKAGYDAFALDDGAESADGAGGAEGASSSERLENARLEEAEKLKRTTIWAALVSLPVMLVSMIPALQFTNWQWAAFAATTLVFFAMSRSMCFYSHAVYFML